MRIVIVKEKTTVITLCMSKYGIFFPFYQISKSFSHSLGNVADALLRNYRHPVPIRLLTCYVLICRRMNLRHPSKS